MSRKDVNYFAPTIRRPFVFNKDVNLKKFLLSKLINAEYESLKAPAFSSFSEQTMKPALKKLCSRLNSLSCQFTWLGDKTSYNNAYQYTSEVKLNPSDLNPLDSDHYGSPPLSEVTGRMLSKKVKGAFRRLSVSIRENKEKEDDKLDEVVLFNEKNLNFNFLNI